MMRLVGNDNGTSDSFYPYWKIRGVTLKGYLGL